MAFKVGDHRCEVPFECFLFSHDHHDKGEPGGDDAHVVWPDPAVRECMNRTLTLTPRKMNEKDGSMTFMYSFIELIWITALAHFFANFISLWSSWAAIAISANGWFH